MYGTLFCADDDLEGYDKLVTGRRKTGRVRENYLPFHYDELSSFMV